MAGAAATGESTESPKSGPGGYGSAKSYLTDGKGIMSWLFTIDHKRIAIMYLGAVSFMLLLAGAFALTLRLELLTPGELLGDEHFYNRMFTLHGAIMVFLFLIPGIPAALGNFILPLQLGVKDLALPRVNLISVWLYWIGGLLFIGVLFLGGLDTGWTFYPPYSMQYSPEYISVLLALGGAFILGFSSILTGLNFIVTIHTMRPKEMGLYQMPLFLWALYATAIIQIIATPVLGITLGLAIVEAAFKIGIFLPEYGGDPVLFQHFFWFYSHPAVYIMLVPAMGVQSEIISVFSRKKIFGYKAIVWSSIGIALVGFMVWGHHMFVSGQSALAGIIFSFITFFVALPSAIKVFNWTATLYKGSIRFTTPMLYALSFMYLFGIGGLTGLFLSGIATNVYLHDTYFVVAHFHMVMVGSALTGFLAGLHYWWPKISGKMYSEKWGRIAAVFVFVGFNVAFMPQFIAGTRGMPRRYARYDEAFTIFHQISTVGAFMLGTGVLITFIYLFHSMFKGRKAPKNPWGASSLEWQADSPPIKHNFHEPPKVRDPYEYRDLEFVSEEEGWRVKDQ